MLNLDKLLKISASGFVSIISGNSAYDGFLKLKNLEVASLKDKFPNASESVDQLYQTLNKTVEVVSSGDFYSGLFSTCLACATGGFFAYTIFKKKK
jgi:hypothetical protein